jgi:hypothetical protein
MISANPRNPCGIPVGSPELPPANQPASIEGNHRESNVIYLLGICKGEAKRYAKYANLVKDVVYIVDAV